MKRLLLLVFLFFCFDCTTSSLIENLIIRCVTQILSDFRLSDGTPFGNFVCAYCHLSLESLKEVNQHASLEYFKELLDKVELGDWEIVDSPRKFCQNKYESANLQDTCRDVINQVDCSADMTGRAAFGHLFLSKSINDLRPDFIFIGQWPTYNPNDRPILQEQKMRSQILLDQKTKLIQEYFMHLRTQVASNCDRTKFRTPREFCETTYIITLLKQHFNIDEDED